MKVIINADDFGIDIDRDLGIFFGVIKGYITSVSIVVTYKINFIRKILVYFMKKKASIGLHINLTDAPLLIYNVEDLCVNNYKYKKNKYNFWENSIDNNVYISKINKEIIAQVDTFIKEYKFIPNHIDGHNHCNIFNRNVEKIFESISDYYNIHLRIPYEDLNNFDKSMLSNNCFFDEFSLSRKISNIQNLKENLDYYFKYDMLLNNYMSLINCKMDKVHYIGTMYGYFRESNVLISQLSKFKKNDYIQIMTHPGFFFSFLKHHTNFSNYDRCNEFKSLKELKKESKVLDLEYINYNIINRERL